MTDKRKRLDSQELQQLARDLRRTWPLQYPVLVRWYRNTTTPFAGLSVPQCAGGRRATNRISITLFSADRRDAAIELVHHWASLIPGVPVESIQVWLAKRGGAMCRS